MNISIQIGTQFSSHSELLRMAPQSFRDQVCSKWVVQFTKSAIIQQEGTTAKIKIKVYSNHIQSAVRKCLKTVELFSRNRVDKIEGETIIPRSRYE